jgi:hypothetical protein
MSKVNPGILSPGIPRLFTTEPKHGLKKPTPVCSGTSSVLIGRPGTPAACRIRNDLDYSRT